LCLSGGATLGLYHLGVIKALFERDLLPRVISGSSVGSIIASLVATRCAVWWLVRYLLLIADPLCFHSTDEELPLMFDMQNFSFNAFDPQGSRWRKINRFLKNGKGTMHALLLLLRHVNFHCLGVLMDITKLQQLLQENIGNVTFREAFQSAFRVFAW